MAVIQITGRIADLAGFVAIGYQRANTATPANTSLPVQTRDNSRIIDVSAEQNAPRGSANADAIENVRIRREAAAQVATDRAEARRAREAFEQDPARQAETRKDAARSEAARAEANQRTADDEAVAVHNIEARGTYGPPRRSQDGQIFLQTEVPRGQYVDLKV